MYEIKVLTVGNFMSDDHFYLEDGLGLPASQEMIKTAMEQAGVTDKFMPYTALYYTCRMEHLNKIMPMICSVDELNYLAQRLSDLSEYERMKYEGAADLLEYKRPTDFINLTYNLECYHMIPEVGNDEQLGHYCIEIDQFGSLRKIPPEMMKYLNHEKLGSLKREKDKGIYAGGNYIKELDKNHIQVYDGEHIPEKIEDTGYYIKLRLTSEMEPDGTWLKLPADEDEVQAALRKLNVKDINQCTVTKCVSTLPGLEKSIDQHSDLKDVIEKVNNVGFGIDQFNDPEMIVKFKAALIYEECSGLDFAADITQNLDCYDFYPPMSSLEEYGRKIAVEKGYLNPADSAMLSCFNFEQYGKDQMALKGVLSTEYGMISRNNNEFYFDYSIPTMEQRI